jgi:hypothetical protein
MRFLCKSGYLNPYTQVCEKAPTSTAKPMSTPCIKTEDCLTSTANVFAPCSCQLLSKLDSTSKVCYPTYGDEQGVEELKLFTDLLAKLKGLKSKCNRYYFEFFGPGNRENIGDLAESGCGHEDDSLELGKLWRQFKCA